jgi:hypothetical protein
MENEIQPSEVIIYNLDNLDKEETQEFIIKLEAIIKDFGMSVRYQ